MLVIFKNCNVSSIPTTSLASTSTACTTTTTTTNSTTTTTSTSLASLWAHFPRHDAQRRFHDISEAPAVFGSSLVKSPFKTNHGAHGATICAANRGSPRQGETPNNAQKAAKWREREGPSQRGDISCNIKGLFFCQMLWGFVWQIWSINVVSAHNPL